MRIDDSCEVSGSKSKNESIRFCSAKVSFNNHPRRLEASNVSRRGPSHASETFIGNNKSMRELVPLWIRVVRMALPSRNSCGESLAKALITFADARPPGKNPSAQLAPLPTEM